MKKCFVILLFLPLLYTQLGYFGQFIWLQWQLKEAAREARLAMLPDAGFVRLDRAAIDAAGSWEEPGKEFRFNGHMYDVIRSRTTGDTTWLFCLDDESEERLDRDLVIRTNQDQPDKRAGHSLCISIGDIICEQPHRMMAAPGPVPRQYAETGDHPVTGRYLEIAGPPPKV